MPATAMNHFTILTDDLDTTLAFYADFLDLHPGGKLRSHGFSCATSGWTSSWKVRAAAAMRRVSGSPPFSAAA